MTQPLRDRVLKAVDDSFSNGLGVECAKGWSTGKDIRKHLDPLITALVECAEALTSINGCGYEIIQKLIDGVMLQGTKHSDQCIRCNAVAKLNALLGPTRAEKE